MMYFLAAFILLTLSPFVKAIPAFGFSPIDTNPLGQPFVNAVLPVQPGFSPRFNLFRRQGCPDLTLLCPSGGCCSYDTSCCGNTCCSSGYLCTGGTAAAPCCVAETAPTNECGGSNGNVRISVLCPNDFAVLNNILIFGNYQPCTRPGDIPCSEVNICCPPNNLCYYDSSNVARCSPLSPSPLSPTTTSRYTPITTPTPIPATTTNPIPVTTTTPYPYPSSSSSSSSTILPSYSGTFWTPAALGGVIGGAVGGVILLAILICICIRRRGSHSDPIADPSVKPLTHGEIYFVVQGLVTTQEWQEAYINEAKRTRAGQHLDRASWMKDFSTRAVEMRVQQLRDGGERNKSMWKAGAIAFVPLVKYWGWFRDWTGASTRKFNRVVIDALGMGDTADVKELYKGAKAAADKSTLWARLEPGIEWVGHHALKEWSANSDLAEELQLQLMKYLTREVGQQAATELMAELVHLKPFIGQIISGTRAMWKCDQKMLKALEWLWSAAVDFHLRVFVVNALTETL